MGVIIGKYCRKSRANRLRFFLFCIISTIYNTTVNPPFGLISTSNLLLLIVTGF